MRFKQALDSHEASLHQLLKNRSATWTLIEEAQRLHSAPGLQGSMPLNRECLKPGRSVWVGNSVPSGRAASVRDDVWPYSVPDRTPELPFNTSSTLQVAERL